MHWIATLSSTDDELGAYDHGIEVEAEDWFDALAAAMLSAGSPWIVVSVDRMLTAEEQRDG